MEPLVRIGTTHKRTYQYTRFGYGFDIERRGVGPASGEWIPILKLVYNTEAESKEAESAIREAIKDPVDAQPGLLP